MKLLVIGGGNMGLTYSEGMSQSPLLNRRKLMIQDLSPDTLSRLRQNPDFEVYANLEDCLPKADIIFIAVKPYHCVELFEKMKGMINDQQVFVSLMASKNVSRVELLMVRNLLDTTGASIHVADESFIDKSTGISGSGPAYVFYFMNSMLEAAKKMGFSDNDSRVLVSSTFEGAVTLFNESDISAQTWMERVASKGGTTQAALDSMEDNNVEELIKEAAYAAFNRAVELGKDPE